MRSQGKADTGALLGIREVAQRKRVSVSAVYKAVRENRLPFVRLAGRNLVREEDAATWMPWPHGGARLHLGGRSRAETPREELARLAREHGVQPIHDIDQLYGDFADVIPENIDEIIRAWRDEPQRPRP